MVTRPPAGRAPSAIARARTRSSAYLAHDQQTSHFRSSSSRLADTPCRTSTTPWLAECSQQRQRAPAQWLASNCPGCSRESKFGGDVFYLLLTVLLTGSEQRWHGRDHPRLPDKHWEQPRPVQWCQSRQELPKSVQCKDMVKSACKVNGGNFVRILPPFQGTDPSETELAALIPTLSQLFSFSIHEIVACQKLMSPLQIKCERLQTPGACPNCSKAER